MPVRGRGWNKFDVKSNSFASRYHIDSPTADSKPYNLPPNTCSTNAAAHELIYEAAKEVHRVCISLIKKPGAVL